MARAFAALVVAMFILPVAGAAADTRLVGASSTGGGTTLYVFNTDADDVGASKSAPVSGLTAGDSVTGLDVRPATGGLTAIATSGGTTQLYAIELSPNNKSAVATPVGGRLPSGGTSFGFDFNPTVDRIRLVNDADENRREPEQRRTAATDGRWPMQSVTPTRGAIPRSPVSRTPTATTTRRPARRCTTSMRPRTSWRSRTRRTAVS